VSLHDPDARPIVKGRLGKPVEFGYKAQITDNADGLVFAYTGIDGKLIELGVVTIAIPRKAKPSAARRPAPAQATPSFRRLIKWRIGAEGRPSALKRSYQMDRTRIDGIDGARTWTGHGVLAHNLVHLAAMT
jgi:transposase, IS5 family